MTLHWRRLMPSKRGSRAQLPQLSRPRNRLQYQRQQVERTHHCCRLQNNFSSRGSVPVLHRCPQNAAFPVRTGPPLHILFFGPTRVHTPKLHLDRFSRFVALKVVRKRQTDTDLGTSVTIGRICASTLDGHSRREAAQSPIVTQEESGVGSLSDESRRSLARVCDVRTKRRSGVLHQPQRFPLGGDSPTSSVAASNCLATFDPSRRRLV